MIMFECSLLFHQMKNEMTPCKFYKQVCHLLFSSSSFLTRLHNFLNDVFADAESGNSVSVESLIIIIIIWLPSVRIPHPVVCLCTSARAELITGANHGKTSIALPLFTSQNSWTNSLLAEPWPLAWQSTLWTKYLFTLLMTITDNLLGVGDPFWKFTLSLNRA